MILRFNKIILLFAFFISLNAFSQTLDTSNKAAALSSVKPYKQVITDKAISGKGLLIVHKTDDRYFFELPENILSKDILVVTRLSKSAADLRAGMAGYAGDAINSLVIRWEKGVKNKIYLRRISVTEYSKDSTMPLYQAVLNNNVQPIIAVFEVKTVNPDTEAPVIDVTDFLNGDNDVFFFHSDAKAQLKLGALQADKSYIESVRSYPINTEIKAVKTYARTPQPGLFGGTSGGGNATVEINASLVLLPSTPMPARYADPRVGYFSVGYVDFDINPQGVKKLSFIKRWRLEPKDEAAYRRGELVEPKKPIIFYIDPATPKKWIPYLIQGVNDWQKTFEKAGFKNAIMAREAPAKAEDSTWSLEDARFSAIVYKPSAVPNASGPSIADPRSGEILESHINWYHSVMDLLQKWYFIQAAPSDERARKMILDDELMGKLIRFVSSHEVGHTLGLLHNFGSSSTVPVESLRNKAWVEKHGHTPSIMDYARFNYVAQPEDKVGEKGIFPRIGDYDLWAIEWGYRLFPQFKDAEAEKAHLNKWVIGRTKDKRLWFGSELETTDPRCQSEALGDDAVKAGEYGIKNLQRIVANLPEWTSVANEDYTSLKEMYNQVQDQFGRYIGHVVRNIGGIYETAKTVEQPGEVYAFVPKEKQKEAMRFLSGNVFATPAWLINEKIYNKIGGDPVNTIGALQKKALNDLMSQDRLLTLISAEAQTGGKTYTLAELMDDLQKAIMKELFANRPVDIYRRDLQKTYIDKLIKLVAPRPVAAPPGLPPGFILTGADAAASGEIVSIAKAQLKDLRRIISSSIPATADRRTKYHLQDCLERINDAIDPK